MQYKPIDATTITGTVWSLFLEHVPNRPDDGCWIYNPWSRRGPQESHLFQFNGTAYLATRVAFAKYNGTVDATLEVCHRCNNPWCIKREHLYQDTHQGNMQYMGRQKRQRYTQGHGQDHHMHKLSDQDVKDIIRRRKAGESPSKLAKEYNITPEYVPMLVRGAATRQRRKLRVNG